MRNWLAAGTLVLALGSSSVRANTYTLDFTGSVFDVSATITTGAAAPGGGYDITSITGYDISALFGKQDITGLVTANGTPPVKGPTMHQMDSDGTIIMFFIRLEDHTWITMDHYSLTPMAII